MDEDDVANDDGSHKGPPLHDEEAWLSTSVPGATPTFLGEGFL